MKPRFHIELTETGLRAAGLGAVIEAEISVCRGRTRTLRPLRCIVSANHAQDAWIPLHQARSELHVDCTALRRSGAYIGSQWQVIRRADRELTACCEGRAVVMALRAFGRLLHVVQDFYSHTTWVEAHHEAPVLPLWDWAADPLGGSLAEREWDPHGWRDGRGPLVSGTWVATPRCRQREDNDWPVAARSGPAPRHVSLNKDSPRSPQGRRHLGAESLHERAMEAARSASAEESRRLEREAPHLVRWIRRGGDGCEGCATARGERDVGLLLAQWRSASLEDAIVAFAELEAEAPGIADSLRRTWPTP